MKNRRWGIYCLIAALMFGSVFGTSMGAKAAGGVMPRWVSVNSATVSLSISGSSAVCTANVTGYSNVKKITGTMTLTLVKNNGTMTPVASWNLTGTQNLQAVKTAAISSAGIYQLTFNGTVTMTDGRTENVTASDVRVY